MAIAKGIALIEKTEISRQTFTCMMPSWLWVYF